MAQETSRLEELKKKKEQLSARIQLLEAAEKSREKKKDTRRKILIGAYMLEQVNEKAEALKELYAKLDSFLTRDSDRVLFNLKPLKGE